LKLDMTLLWNLSVSRRLNSSIIKPNLIWSKNLLLQPLLHILVVAYASTTTLSAQSKSTDNTSINTHPLNQNQPTTRRSSQSQYSLVKSQLGENWTPTQFLPSLFFFFSWLIVLLSSVLFCPASFHYLINNNSVVHLKKLSIRVCAILSFLFYFFSFLMFMFWFFFF
jgi:hypothetical protein